jgi:hypothetical protein
MITVTEHSLLQATEPGAAAIQAAWMRSRPPLFRGSPDPFYGHWEGSGPRITRTASLGGILTTATQPYTWPDTLSPADLPIFETWVTTHLNYDLFPISPDFTRATVTAYTPAVNGALVLWQNGTAQNSASRDAPIAGVLTQADNPAGPVVPPSPSSGLTEAVRATGALAAVVVIGIGLVEFGPVLARALGAGQR